MQGKEIQMHYRAARAAGEASACGTKVRHPNEQRAQAHAASLNRHPSRINNPDCTDWKEAYPCPFCYLWHVGRKMTDEERERFSVTQPD